MAPDPLIERALQKSYRLLSLRARSEKELRQKLKARGYDKGAIDEVVVLLNEQGYLNDASFAVQWARHLAIDKLLGNYKIEASLLEKGIGRELAKDAIHDARQEIEEADAIRRLIGKKMKLESQKMDDRLKKRLYRNLLTKGFAPGLIYGILRSEEEWQYDDGQ
jgi:regulatory protein